MFSVLRLAATTAIVLLLAGCGSSASSSSTTGQGGTTPVQASSGLSPSAQQFAGDMRTDFNYSADVSDSELANFGNKTCTDLRNGETLPDVVSAARADWSHTTKGEAIVMVHRAERDLCPAQAVPQTITYVVSGDPADVTYGPSGSNADGSSPMTVTRPLGSPSYYAISAQLDGGGTVHCALEVDGITLSTATGTGGYNIADCEISKDGESGAWEDSNS